jgi:enamine deaminase RidA (YjgF/YER057c/UK114 family)
MTYRRQIRPGTVFPSAAHGFPQAVAVAAGTTLYVSGQVAWDADRRVIGGGDLAAQARAAFGNVLRVVEDAGGTPSAVVAVRIYIVQYRPEHADAVGGAFRACFEADTAPATTWIGVTALAHPDLLIEVEAVAVLD